MAPLLIARLAFFARNTVQVAPHQIRSTWNKCVNQALTSCLVHIFPEQFFKPSGQPIACFSDTLLGKSVGLRMKCCGQRRYGIITCWVGFVASNNPTFL